MRRNSSTIVVLAGPVPDEVLAAMTRSMNVALIRPEPNANANANANADGDGDGDGDVLKTAAVALRQAGRVTSPYALVAADPLAALADAWQAMWDVSRQEGPAHFEQEAAKTLTAWRTNQFELPDYYLVLAAEPVADHAPGPAQDAQAPDFYLGPLRSSRPHRVSLVAATDPAQQAAGVLHALASLRHGPWWPPLDDLVATARNFYPGSLASPPLSRIRGQG